MDFTTEQIDQGLNGLTALTGDDYAGLSSVSAGAQREFISLEISSILNRQDVVEYSGYDIESGVTQPSQQRTQISNNLQSAITSRTPADANKLRGVGMAHLLWMQQRGMEVPHNVTFTPSEDDLSAAEIEALEGIVRLYDTNNIAQLQNDFQRASATQQYTQIRQELDAIDSANRAADIAYIQEGLQILGYIPGDVALDEITPEQLKDGLLQYSRDAHMGLQGNGSPAQEYADAHYQNPNIHTQRAALYGNDFSEADLLDSGMARAMVEAGLDVTGGLPPALTNGGGGMNYSAVHAMAERGGLIPVPDDYLTPEQKELFELFGGQASEAGQAHLLRMIDADNGHWYAQGLEQHTAPILERAVHASGVDAELGAINAGIITDERIQRYGVFSHEVAVGTEAVEARHEELSQAAMDGDYFDEIYSAIESGIEIDTASLPELARYVELHGEIGAAERTLTSYQINPAGLNTYNEWGIRPLIPGMPDPTISAHLENNIIDAQNNFMEHHNDLTAEQRYNVARAIHSDPTAVAAIPADQDIDFSAPVAQESERQATLGDPAAAYDNLNARFAPAMAGAQQPLEGIDALREAMIARTETDQDMPATQISHFDPSVYQGDAGVPMEMSAAERTSPELVSGAMASSNVAGIFMGNATGEDIRISTPQSAPAMSAANPDIMAQFASSGSGEPPALQQSTINPDLMDGIQQQPAARSGTIAAFTH